MIAAQWIAKIDMGDRFREEKPVEAEETITGTEIVPGRTGVETKDVLGVVARYGKIVTGTVASVRGITGIYTEDEVQGLFALACFPGMSSSHGLHKIILGQEHGHGVFREVFL